MILNKKYKSKESYMSLNQNQRIKKRLRFKMKKKIRHRQNKVQKYWIRLMKWKKAYQNHVFFVGLNQINSQKSASSSKSLKRNLKLIILNKYKTMYQRTQTKNKQVT